MLTNGKLSAIISLMQTSRSSQQATDDDSQQQQQQQPFRVAYQRM